MTKSKNAERRERILTDAADLFIHYGYDKTTIRDIARQAGVSQGGIYQYFKGKDDLLEQIIIHEMMIYAEKWLELIDADPNGGTIAAMYKNSLYALDSSTFMTAVFKRDGRIFGTYLRKEDNFFRKQNPSTRYDFVKLMQDAGAIRQDIDAHVIAHIMNIMAYGLVAMDEIMDRENMPPVEDMIEGMAAIMDTALTPPSGGNVEAGKAILKQISAAARVQLEEAKQSDEE